MKNFWERNEPTWHRLMGFGAMLFNSRLLLERRERKSLPPENDQHPVMFIFEGRNTDGSYSACLKPDGYRIGREYWSKARVMDTLDDMRQYDQGGTIGWLFVLGLGIAIGWAI